MVTTMLDDAAARNHISEMHMSLNLRRTNPAPEAIVHVLSMKALVRAFRSLSKVSADRPDDFEQALVKMINLNGAMARAIGDGRG